jgi:ParB-like chromosome segregation protein Spo0J
MGPPFTPLNQISLPETVEQRPISDLLPHAANARTHFEEQVDQLVASIRKFGWTNPMLVGPDGVIIADHARVLAAARTGLRVRLPCY